MDFNSLAFVWFTTSIHTAQGNWLCGEFLHVSNGSTRLCLTAKRQYPAFSLVWKLRISSSCSKPPRVLKGSLHFGLRCIKHCWKLLEEAKGENMISIIMEVQCGDSSHTDSQLDFLCGDVWRSSLPAVVQTLSCHFLYSSYTLSFMSVSACKAQSQSSGGKYCSTSTQVLVFLRYFYLSIIYFCSTFKSEILCFLLHLSDRVP